MSQKQDSNPAQLNVVNNEVQQEVGQNQGQVVGQMADSQAVSAQEIGVFVSGGSVVFQSSGKGHSQLISQEERTIPSLLPYLANRSDQEFELRQKIRTHLQQTRKCPLVCIIHGDEFQSHDKFLEKLQKVTLPRMLNLDATKVVIKAHILAWPGGEELENLPERLRNNLAEVVGVSLFASTEEINQTFCKYPGPIIVETHLLTEDWEFQGAIVLHKLLNFWNDWPELALGQKLIVCISIKYQVKHFIIQKHRCFLKPLASLQRFSKRHRYLDSKRHRYLELNQKIHQYLHEIEKSKFSQYDNLNCIVLTELSGITRTHVENWVRKEETKEFIGEAMLEKFIDSVRDMFEQWESQTSSSTMSMDELAEQLIELLRS